MMSASMISIILTQGVAVAGSWYLWARHVAGAVAGVGTARFFDDNAVRKFVSTRKEREKTGTYGSWCW